MANIYDHSHKIHQDICQHIDHCINSIYPDIVNNWSDSDRFHMDFDIVHNEHPRDKIYSKSITHPTMIIRFVVLTLMDKWEYKFDRSNDILSIDHIPHID